MLRDNLAGLIEPMPNSAGADPLALCTARKKSSDDRPPCLENPRPEGAESTLTENAASPFHAEPRHTSDFVTDITNLRAPSPSSEKLFAPLEVCRMKLIARVWPFALVGISLIGLVYVALAHRF
jgi:hypothetical protein